MSILIWARLQVQAFIIMRHEETFLRGGVLCSQVPKSSTQQQVHEMASPHPEKPTGSVRGVSAWRSSEWGKDVFCIKLGAERDVFFGCAQSWIQQKAAEEEELGVKGAAICNSAPDYGSYQCCYSPCETSKTEEELQAGGCFAVLTSADRLRTNKYKNRVQRLI